MPNAEQMKRARELASTKTAKEILTTLTAEFGSATSLRTIYRWLERKTDSEQSNWIKGYQQKHKGRLPLIPKFMLAVVRDKTAQRVSKNMELSIPSAQWWNDLLPSQKEQVLQTVDWLCRHNKDWWCKSREDYLEMIRRHTPRGPSSPIVLQWKR